MLEIIFLLAIIIRQCQTFAFWYANYFPHKHVRGGTEGNPI